MTSAYSPEQIERYLDYIEFPQHLRAPGTPKDLEFLTALHVHQISRIPYDNLSLHYSESHTNSLDPQVLYTKFTNNGRGGYCMETATFFRHVLRALGFRTYTAGARIRLRPQGIPQGPYVGWVHCVNIVTLDNGDKYMEDVGFGGDGPTKPLPLTAGHAVQNLGSQEIRLVYESMPEASEPDQKLWIYQYRNGREREWNPFYAFPEFEAFHADLLMNNYWTSTNPASFQTKQILLVKFLRSSDGDDGDDDDGDEHEGSINRIVGKIMMVNGTIKRNMGGKTEIVQECRSEVERIEALKRYFDVSLTQQEIEGIKGTVTELVPGAAA